MGKFKEWKKRKEDKKRQAKIEEGKKMKKIIEGYKPDSLSILKKYINRVPEDTYAICISPKEDFSYTSLTFYPLDANTAQIVCFSLDGKRTLYIDYMDDMYAVAYALTLIYPLAISPDLTSFSDGFGYNLTLRAILKHARICLHESVVSQYDDIIAGRVVETRRIWYKYKNPHILKYKYGEENYFSDINKLYNYVIQKSGIDNKKNEIPSRNKKDETIKAGEKGESDVSYALKYLDGFKIIDKDSNNGEQVILLNSSYMDEGQEYDHILVGSKGIILVETKAYAGRITVDEDGNWTREKEGGKKEGIRSPLQQIGRHEKLMRSIVGETIPVISVICLANEHVIIEGSKNSKIPIVTIGNLVDWIESLESSSLISDEKAEGLYMLIKGFMVNSQHLQ